MRATLALRPLAVGAIFLPAALIPAGKIGPYDNIGKIVTFQKPGDAVAEHATPAWSGRSLRRQACRAWHKSDGKTPAGWKFLPGSIMQMQGGDILTREQLFGSFRLHVEFRVPYTPKTPAQNRGKSGIFLLGHHEIRILDSYGRKSGNQDCGAIATLVTAILVEASRDLKILERNSLKEELTASPVATHGSLFIRTKGHLYRIGPAK